MGLVVLGRGEEGFVGGDERNPLGVGEIDQCRLNHPLFRCAVALQLHIEPVAEQAHERVGSRLDQVRLSGHQSAIEHAVRAPRQRDQTVRMPVEPFELDMGQLGAGVIEVRTRIKMKEIAVAGFGRGEQNEPR